MRRILLGVGVLLGLALLGIVAVFAVSFSGLPAIPDGLTFSGFGRIVKTGYSSASVIDLGNHQLALIDCGATADAHELIASLAKNGFVPGDVKAIFLTHGHADHTAGCSHFPGAELYAMAADVPLVEGRVKSRGPVTRLIPAKATGLHVSHPLQGGETIVLGQREVKAFAVPGHTPGSAAYQVGDVLFLGDSADATKTGTLVPAKWLVTDDPAENRASVKRLAGEVRGVNTLVSSHTGVLLSGIPLQQF